MKYLTVLIVLLLAGLIYIRLAPSDHDRWHGDPLSAQAEARGGWLLRPVRGNAPGPVFDTDPATLLAAFDEIALTASRTTRLAGGVNEGRITYVTRSRWMGFPDYTTATALPAAGGVMLAIHARQRFGTQDMGVNRARVEGWVQAVEQRLSGLR
jgi:hypothetical protein